MGAWGEAGGWVHGVGAGGWVHGGWWVGAWGLVGGCMGVGLVGGGSRIHRCGQLICIIIVSARHYIKLNCATERTMGDCISLDPRSQPRTAA